jgi:hypothetical protein
MLIPALPMLPSQFCIDEIHDYRKKNMPFYLPCSEPGHDNL